jgi:hypothetical protein
LAKVRRVIDFLIALEIGKGGGEAMPERSFAVIIGFVAVTIVGAALSAAQTQTPTGQQGTSLTLPHARTQIEIYPRGLLYRRCTDWYELQHRPSETVLYPHMRRWWVRG